MQEAVCSCRTVEERVHQVVPCRAALLLHFTIAVREFVLSNVPPTPGASFLAFITHNLAPSWIILLERAGTFQSVNWAKYLAMMLQAELVITKLPQPPPPPQQQQKKQQQQQQSPLAGS
jgi:hypothetical protein